MEQLAGKKKIVSNKTAWFLLVALLAVLSVTARGSDWTGFAFILLGSFILVALSFRLPDQRLINILHLAFFVRLGFLLYSTYIAPLPVEGSDSVTFENLAWRSAQAWLAGEPGALEGGGRYYIAIIAALYSAFGRVELIPRFVTLLAGLLAVFLTYKTAFLITGRQQAARLAALAAALFPTLAVYSAVLLREQFVILFFTFSAFFFFRWLKDGSLLYMVVSIAFLFLSSLYHGGMIAIGAAYLLLFLIYSPSQKSWFNIRHNLGLRLGALGLTGGFFLVFWNFFRTKIPSSLFEGSVQQLYYDLTGSTIYGRTAYLAEFVPTGYLDLVWQTPLRIFYFSFTPFLWQVEIFMDFVVFIDAIIFGAALLLFLYGWRFVKPEQRAFYIAAVLIVLVFLGAFAWGTHNFGTALRHRQKIAWLLFSFASLSIVSFAWWDNLTAKLAQIKGLRFVRLFI